MTFVTVNEAKWQQKWNEAKIFEADLDPAKRKCFVTFPYPYMNGPLHVGHAFTASRLDCYARFKRMQGYNVLFPWAWHWTGQPLMGASERIAKGDQVLIKILQEVDSVPKHELEKFVDPVYMATYYTNEGRLVAKKAGFSVDWRREFNTTMPHFQRFIEWQYALLMEKKYVSKGTHPVVWCPQCQSPTGDHDRQIGEGVNPEEYHIIKFKFQENYYFPAATFRPETIFGVTNLWINPDSEYVKAKVKDEIWIISERAATKLREQGTSVTVLQKVKGNQFVGKKIENPLTKAPLLILPGYFVDPEQGTGIVYSVPAHAPYDWLALKDLQEHPELLKNFGISPEKIQEIKPISVIKLEGFGDYPAIELVKTMNITNQQDEKVGKATKIIYKKEFHQGMLKENCMEYAGKLVNEVKDDLIADLQQRGIATIMVDLPQKVTCRCLTPCLVKVLADQWFLTYSNPDWKLLVKEAVANLKLYPDSARQWFYDVIDWLRDWACTRRTGLGTPLPWSSGWIIETLSDSTIYMAFYTINKHINRFHISPEDLTKDVFDYVFLGKGHLDHLQSTTNLSRKILQEMRSEFLYWYPVDLRVSAKELVPNHLTFFLFHHVALFPSDLWPKTIGVNGMLLIDGKPMHKSKGNFVTLKNAINTFGADATRCALILGAEAMEDPDWTSDKGYDTKRKLSSFHKFVVSIIHQAYEEETGPLEKWITSILQNRINQVTQNLDQMKTRTALEIAFFEVWKDLRWYIRRKGNVDSIILLDIIKIWVRLLAPFAPHLCEELWESLGGVPFVCTASWPEYDPNLKNLQIEEGEDLIRRLIEDTKNIIRVTKTQPSHIYYYVASPNKWSLYLSLLKHVDNENINMGNLMKKLLADSTIRENAKLLVKSIPALGKEIGKLPEIVKTKHLQVGSLDEEAVLTYAKSFLSSEFNAEISIFQETDKHRYDPQERAKFANPYRPAIFIK